MGFTNENNLIFEILVKRFYKLTWNSISLSEFVREFIAERISL